MPYIWKTIIEEEIPRFSACCFGKQICTSPNTSGSESGIAYEHDQLVMFISINQIGSPQGRLIPVTKKSKIIRKYHVATILVDHFSKYTYYTSVKVP